MQLNLRSHPPALRLINAHADANTATPPATAGAAMMWRKANTAGVEYAEHVWRQLPGTDCGTDQENVAIDGASIYFQTISHAPSVTAINTGPYRCVIVLRVAERDDCSRHSANLASKSCFDAAVQAVWWPPGRVSCSA
jgi:hypothetical protein